MAERGAAGDDGGKFRSVSDNESQKRRVVRQPNRRQLERELQTLTEQISVKEAELRALGRPNIESTPAETLERENLLKEQKLVREEKEATIKKRKEYDETLHKLGDEILKTRDGLSKLEASLPQKTEKAVDQAIKKLEYQLQTQHFKLRDEKRIINEITNLRRSKKQVHLYQTKRTEWEADKRKKEDMKTQRNVYFKQVSVLKTKEDEIRQKLLRIKSKTDEAWTRYREAGPERERIKQEIDNMYEMRRQLNADFQSQMRDYREFVELQRIENERRKDEERKVQEARHRQEWFEYESSREPFEDERHQIESLIAYLHKLQPKGEGQAQSGAGSPSNGASPSASVSSASTSLGRSSSFRDEEGTFTILRKKGDEDEDVFLQAASNRKKKNKRKSWLNKPLRHSRQIFNQFASLDLSAPSTALEVESTIEKLQVKLQYYQDAATSVKMAHSAIKQNLGAPAPEVMADVDGYRAEASSGDEKPAASDSTEAEDATETKVSSEDIENMQNTATLDVAQAQLSHEAERAVVSEHGSGKIDNVAEESHSSVSDDVKDNGDITDDSESTVVANEGDGVHGNGSAVNKQPQDVQKNSDLQGDSTMQDDSDVRGTSSENESLVSRFLSQSQDNELLSVDNSESLEVIEQEIYDSFEFDPQNDELDKDKEDSGVVDLREEEPKKVGIVERKNKDLKLIVSRREKDIDSSKNEVLASQNESSSDYASNSTGSAVSTPTDCLPVTKRGVVLDASNPSTVKDTDSDLVDSDDVFQDQNENSSSVIYPLQRLALSIGTDDRNTDNRSKQPSSLSSLSQDALQFLSLHGNLDSVRDDKLILPQTKL